MSDAGLTFAALVLPSGARSYELADLRCIAASQRDERIAKQGRVAYPEAGASGVLWKMGEGSRVINLIFVMIILATGTAHAEQAGCSATPGKEISVPLIKEEDQREWIARKLAGAGEIEEATVLPHAPVYFRKGNRGGKLAMVTFDGMLRVSDPTRMTELLENGIGPAKWFGCGLLLVRRL